MRELYQHLKEGEVNILELGLPDQMDSSEFDRINEQLLGLVAPAAEQRWVIDLTESRHMGSAVLGMLVNVRQRIKNSRGRLVVCGVTGPLLHIFQITSLERLFTLCRTRADALRMLR